MLFRFRQINMSQAGQFSVNGSTNFVQTITGDSGGAVPPAAGNINFIAGSATQNSGSSVTIVGSIATHTLTVDVTDANGNTLIGNLAGNAVLSGTDNVALGTNNGHALTTGSTNTFIGFNAGESDTTGSNNTFVGNLSGAFITTGAYNSFLGSNSGLLYVSSESSNICINNEGTVAESNTLRIGAATGTGNQQLSRAFICGIDGVNVGSVARVVTEASNQLGTAVITAGTGITVTPGANTITIAATGTMQLTVTSVNHAASPYTVLSTDEFLAVDTSGGVVSILLPNAPVTGRVFYIKDSKGTAFTSNITVTTVGGVVNIDGATSYTMNTNYASIGVIWDGSSYEIF